MGSYEVDQFIAMVQRQYGTECMDEASIAKANDCISSDTVSVPPPLPSLERDRSLVVGCGITAGEPLSSKNIDNFKTALTQKLLLDNLQPHLKHVCDEFHAVVSVAKQGRTWEEI